MAKLFTSTPIFSEVYARLKEHCTNHGLKISWTVSKAIDLYLDKVEAAAHDNDAPDNVE